MVEKKTLDDKFDVVSVINKTYQDSTEYDLNDSLIFLSNVISKTKVKNKELVKRNFSKFVECRVVLEEILEDMKKKGGDQKISSEVKENIKNIEKKFPREILANSHYDDERDRRMMIEKKYKTLFNIKSLLKENLRHRERFVRIYQEGRKEYNELKGSLFVQRLWEGIKEIRILFLEDIYRDIQSQESSFVEVLYSFDLYFKVCEKKTERKIMNTLLLNFKEKVLDIPYVEKGYFLKDTNYLYLRTMSHLDKELQKELTKTLFDRVRGVFSTSSLPFIKIWTKKYKRLISKVEVSLEVSSAYFTILKSLKKDLVHQRIDEGMSMDTLLENFLFFNEILEKDEKYILTTRVLEVIQEKVKVEDEDRMVNKLSRFEEFIKDDTLEEIKTNIKNKKLRKEIVKLCEFIKKSPTKASVLMEVVKIIERIPEDHKKIILGAGPLVEKDRVLLFYLHNLLEKEEPNLNNREKEEAGRLEKQFAFLKE